MGCGQSSPKSSAVAPTPLQPAPAQPIAADKRSHTANANAGHPLAHNSTLPASNSNSTSTPIEPIHQKPKPPRNFNPPLPSKTVSAPEPTLSGPAEPAAASAAPVQAELTKKFPKPARKRHQTASTLEISAEEVSQHNSAKSYWTIYRGFVYDITDFADSHPGGEGLLKRQAAGKDCTEEFDNYLHSESAFHMLKAMLVGKLTSPPTYKPNALGQYALKAGLPSSLPEDATPPAISETHLKYTENKSNHSGKDSSANTHTLTRSKLNNKSANNANANGTGNENQTENGKEGKSNLKNEDSVDTPGGDNRSLLLPLGSPAIEGNPGHHKELSALKSGIGSISARNLIDLTPAPEHPTRNVSAPVRANPVDDPNDLVAQIQRSFTSSSNNTESNHITSTAVSHHAHRTNSQNFPRKKTTDSPVLVAHRPQNHQPIDHHIYHFRLEEIDQITADVKHFKFKQIRNDEETPVFNSGPGSAIMIRIPIETLKPFIAPGASPPPTSIPTPDNPAVYLRPYTLTANNPGLAELTIKSYPTGSVSRYMFSLRVGDELETSGARGRFFFDDYYGFCACRKAIEEEKSQSNATQSSHYFPGHSHYRKWIFIAGGTGITPFHRLISLILHSSSDRTYADRFPDCRPPSIQLLYANRSARDVLFRVELLQLAEQHSNFSILHLLPKPEVDDEENRNLLKSITNERSTVEHARIDAELLKRFIPHSADAAAADSDSDSEPALALLCGPDNMIAAITKLLESNHFQRGSGNKRDLFLF